MLEHDEEPVPGLPEALPDGERLLWQGAPEFRSLVRGTFHLPELAAYFAVLLALRVVFQVADGAGFLAAVAGSLWLVSLAAVAIGILLSYARLVARSTLFTITSRRVVIRCGVALPLTMNLPFSRIETADLRLRGDGSGDISLTTDRSSRVSYVLLWPFVKPWRWIRVQPILRGVPDASPVAEILAGALRQQAAGAGRQITRDPEMPADAPRDPAPARRWSAYPTVPLTAAVSLVVVAVVATAWTRFADAPPAEELALPAATAQIDLFFEDRADGSVVVVGAGDGAVVEVLEPGSNGFLRSTVRSLVRARRAADVGSETPFSVRRTAAGQLLLHDPATGQRIDLRAFGATNAEVFARFLEHRPPGAASVEPNMAEPNMAEPNIVEPNMAQAALTSQENTQ